MRRCNQCGSRAALKCITCDLAFCGRICASAGNHREENLPRELVVAVRDGRALTVRNLLRVVEPDVNAIITASQNGHAEIVELLLEDGRADPSADMNFALYVAAKNGHWDIVEMLLDDPRVDDAPMLPDVIVLAVKGASIETLRRLLDNEHTPMYVVCDDALMAAIDSNRPGAALLLLNHPNFKLTDRSLPDYCKLAKEKVKRIIKQFM